MKNKAILKELSMVPPFCPKCGTLCYPDPEHQISCKAYRCQYHGPLHPILHQKLKNINAEFIALTGLTPIQPTAAISRNTENLGFQILEKKSKSFTGYFDWPSTEIYPTFHGSNIDPSVWPDQSPLNLMGYNVNSKENLSNERRQEILSFVYASPTLPYVKNESYMSEWGPANSRLRLKKIADNLATHGRNMRKKVYLTPLAKYDADLAYLKKKYYDDMFSGDWPSTQLQN
ncbi:hypothetical protein OAO46_01365 [Candidatus Poseidonia alphae]|nr:hypothetical protein [Candidatus Poseidonia alphae]